MGYLAVTMGGYGPQSESPKFPEITNFGSTQSPKIPGRLYRPGDFGREVRELISYSVEAADMTQTKILGIDPGLTGGWALLTDHGAFVGADDLPIIRDNSTAWVDAPELVAQINACLSERVHIRAVIERVHSMPAQGISSAFTFGVGFGSVLACLQLLPASIEFVSPAAWKRGLGLSKDKSASLDRARLLYPQASLKRQKDDGRAEALLIAHWAWKGTAHG